MVGGGGGGGWGWRGFAFSASYEHTMLYLQGLTSVWYITCIVGGTCTQPVSTHNGEKLEPHVGYVDHGPSIFALLCSVAHHLSQE